VSPSGRTSPSQVYEVQEAAYAVGLDRKLAQSLQRFEPRVPRSGTRAQRARRAPRWQGGRYEE
jgi:hypothetical protein